MYTITGAQSRSDYSVNVKSFISVLVKLLCFVSGTVKDFDDHKDNWYLVLINHDLPDN